MPGHKGSGVLGCENLDITEINGADDLFFSSGIIAQSEENASSLFGSKHTFYSTGGSSLCIKAMLFLAQLFSGAKSNKVLAMRNSHKAFYHACALLDLQPVWLCDEHGTSFYSCELSAKTLTRELQNLSEKPLCVFVTSPDYLGKVCDIKALATVCENHDIPLLVDNAHGAYLAFLKSSGYEHPISCGAHMCCDSAHKTLPVITGGAYLHVGKTARFDYGAHAKKAMAYFGSTSPSYLIMQSLDYCNKLLAKGYDKEIEKCANYVLHIKQKLQELGVKVEISDPLRIVINANSKLYTGAELANILRENSIECEYSDDIYVVLMVTPNNKASDFIKLLSVFKNLQCGNLACFNGENEQNPKFSQCTPILTPRQAMFSKSESVHVENCIGRICAVPAVSCPPAVPIVMGGEIVTENVHKTLLYFGVTHLDVVVIEER